MKAPWNLSDPAAKVDRCSRQRLPSRLGRLSIERLHVDGQDCPSYGGVGHVHLAMAVIFVSLAISFGDLLR